jgi:hypothetical protein
VFHALHHTRGVNTSNETQDQRFSRGFSGYDVPRLGIHAEEKLWPRFTNCLPPLGPEAPHYRSFKLSRLLVHFDHVASFIANANDGIV